MDRANFALARYLADLGHDVDLVAHRVSPELSALPNVRSHLVVKPLKSYFLGQGFLARRGQIVGRQVSADGGRVIVNGGNCVFPDVNWVHYVHAAYRPDSAVSPVRRLKRRLEYPLNIAAERRALTAARIIVCNSRRTQRDVVEKVGVAPEKTHIVYYGNDSDEFHPVDFAARQALRRQLNLPADRPLAAFVGALGDRRKGFDVLFAAWQSLAQSKASAPMLVVIGAGAELDAWRRCAAETGLDEHVRFLGFRSDVPDILRAVDLLVAPTRYEAYGLGVQEALCCGVPAIVAADAGVAEKYPDDLRDLLIDDVENAAALSEQIKAAFENIDDYRARCAPLSEALRSRTWDHMSAEIVRVMSGDDASHAPTPQISGSGASV